MFNQPFIRNLVNGTNKLKTANTNQSILNELINILQEIETHLKSSKVEKAGNWMIEEDLWLQNEKHQLSKFYNYSRGDIIRTLDLGTTNIGTEIRYPHPIVVLYDQSEDWIVGVPITQASLDEQKKPIIHIPFEVLVRKQIRRPNNPKEFFFTKDSVIQIDQIRRISKFRAVNKQTFKLRNDLLNQIDNILFKYFIPQKQQLLSKIIQMNKKNEETIQQLENRNKNLENTVELLTMEVEQYKSNLSKDA